MIAFVRGTVAAAGDGYVVVAVGDVGVVVYVPRPLLGELPPAGERLLLHTHLVVREDALTLYGFGQVEQRAMFATLLGVSGVGPRLALAMLSACAVDEIRGAVAAGDVARLVRVPGIGRRLAERLVVELKDRLDLTNIPRDVAAAAPMDAAVNAELAALLVSLGYSGGEAQAAIAALPADAPLSLEERLRLALRYFGGA